jgi:hypothetical protein
MWCLAVPVLPVAKHHSCMSVWLLHQAEHTCPNNAEIHQDFERVGWDLTEEGSDNGIQ